MTCNPQSPQAADAVRAWLICAIGGSVNVYGRGNVPAAGGAQAGHHFAVSVPIADQDSLYRLRSLRGPVLFNGGELEVVLVVPRSAIDHRGRWAHREVSVHVRRAA